MNMVSLDSIVIGIDLGTANCCVAYYYDKNLRVLKNREGGRTTPSYVLFTEKNPPVIVGEHAKNTAHENPRCTIYGIKRLIGRKFDDKCIQATQRNSQFTITDVGNKPMVEIQAGNQTFTRTPQELTYHILKKIKEDVDVCLKSNITKAVITVPAHFNSLQRKETLEAAKQAGFTVLKLFNEPNAAALNFYHDNPKYCGNLMVYDLGGGTFDVSILKKTKNNLEVLWGEGHCCLVGNDFDDCIQKFVCTELLKRYGIDVFNNKPQLMLLKTKCEKAKEVLSAIDRTNISLEYFVKAGHKDRFSIPFTREKFEDLINDFLKTTLVITKKCLKKSKLNIKDIQQVILVGGSTRIPRIEAMLTSFFEREFGNKELNPDECIAFGAALQAAMLSEHPRQKIEKLEEKLKIVDVVPLSIGQMDIGGSMEVFIKKNTPIPASFTKPFWNVEHNQMNMLFPIYEGERLDCRKNTELGRIVINLTPSPPRNCIVSLTIHIDSAGILTCTALEHSTGRIQVATIDSYTIGMRSDREVMEAIEDAKKRTIEDEQFRAYSKHIGYLRSYCAAITYNMIEKKLDLTHKDLFLHCREITGHFKTNLFYYTGLSSVHQMIEELTRKFDQLVKAYNFENMPVPIM